MRAVIGVVAISAVLCGLAASGAPYAQADPVGYLVNVTVRPGYNFPNAETALGYGNGICEKVRAGRSYAEIAGEIKADFSTDDEYQATYLISQAVQELCAALTWQLRNSAAGYRPPPGAS
jgi:hypothetical protein